MTERLTDEALDETLLNEQGWAFVEWMNATGSTMSGHAFNNIKPKLREIIIAHRRATPADDLRAAVRTALEGELSYGAYDCTRVWEAWSVGTMTQDDFVPVSERLDEITDAVVAVISQPAPAPQPANDLRAKAQRYAELLRQAEIELEAIHRGSGFAATIRAALSQNGGAA